MNYIQANRYVGMVMTLSKVLKMSRTSCVTPTQELNQRVSSIYINQRFNFRVTAFEHIPSVWKSVCVMCDMQFVTLPEEVEVGNYVTIGIK